MHHHRHSRYCVQLLQPFKMDLRLVHVKSVRRSHCDGNAVHLRAIDKICQFIRLCKKVIGIVKGILLRSTDLAAPYNAVSHMTELRFYADIETMCIRDDLACLLNILLQRQHRAVKHHGRKTAVDATLDKRKVHGVIEMDCNRNGCCLGNFAQITEPIGKPITRKINSQPHQDDRRFLFFRNLRDSQCHIKVAHIKCTDSIFARSRVCQHLLHIYQRHIDPSSPLQSAAFQSHIVCELVIIPSNPR